MTEFEQVRAAMMGSTKKAAPQAGGLSTGSTLLNLAITGDPDWGFGYGRYSYFVGDSSSGKTFILLTSLAAAASNKRFDSHRFVFDNAENGALMEIQRFFGKHVAERLEPPAGTIKRPQYSSTVESFYENVAAALKTGPCIYILDSMDALSDDEEEKQFNSGKLGGYGATKARTNSRLLRIVHNRLKGSQSILLVVGQTRQNMGFTAQARPRTRSGGDALTFYAASEIWSSVKGHITTNYKGSKLEQGIVCKVRIRKNRETGRDREVAIPIYHSYGIDNTGGCIDFLVESGHWKAAGQREGEWSILPKGKIKAPEFRLEATRERLVQKIEGSNAEDKLRELVTRVWNEREEAIAIQRKPRFQ